MKGGNEGDHQELRFQGAVFGKQDDKIRTSIQPESVLLILPPYVLNNILLPVVAGYVLPSDRYFMCKIRATFCHLELNKRYHSTSW